MKCHITTCGYPQGECTGECGTIRRHVKPYPNTADDMPIQYAEDEEAKDRMESLALYGLSLIALMCFVVGVLTFAAWIVS